jgi:hypothetical protein
MYMRLRIMAYSINVVAIVTGWHSTTDLVDKADKTSVNRMSAATILMEMSRTMGGNSDENEILASFSLPGFPIPVYPGSRE